MPDFVITAVIFVAILSVLVLVHELGHFTVARLIGVFVEEFGFGLPPKIFGKKIGKTLYSLNALPIGGFVRLAGEDEEDNQIRAEKKKLKGKELKKYFWARTKLERAAILVAGVTMNFVLAWAIVTGLLIYGIEEPAPWVKIEEVTANTPAAISGVKPQDIVKEITYTDAKGSHTLPTRMPQELIDITRKNMGNEVVLHVTRGTEQLRVPVTPRKEYPTGEGPMGIKIGYDIQNLKYPWYEAPFQSVVFNVKRSRDMLVAIATLPSRALQGQNVQDEVAGPIGIAQITGQAAKVGPIAVFNLMSILSLSLALLNFLPIPALDGGRLLFVFIEAVVGKKVKPQIERRAHQIGMLGLLLFILLVTLNDLSRFLH
jgi:regulator of sigma E protease